MGNIAAEVIPRFVDRAAVSSRHGLTQRTAAIWSTKARFLKSRTSTRRSNFSLSTSIMRRMNSGGTPAAKTMRVFCWTDGGGGGGRCVSEFIWRRQMPCRREHLQDGIPRNSFGGKLAKNVPLFLVRSRRRELSQKRIQLLHNPANRAQAILVLQRSPFNCSILYSTLGTRYFRRSTNRTRSCTYLRNSPAL
jgi:hypothetical protein